MIQNWNITAHKENRLYNRSLALLDGDGVAQDYTEAFLLNAKAAKAGHHDAILAMGWFYLNGIGTDRDLDKSWYWYRKSARHRDPRAMFSLGYLCYIEGAYIEANNWFSKAAGLKHNRSVYWLAKLFWKGRGVAEDKKRARTLIQQAAKANVPEAKRASRFLSRRVRASWALFRSPQPAPQPVALK
jgi:TPR repeat protein